MLKVLGLAWRISLVQESLFYFRTCHNWRMVIRGRINNVPFDKFEMRSGKVVAFSGTPPWQVFQEIWRYRVYDRKYPRTLPTPSIVVDIGANIGLFAHYAASRWPLAKIYAYEPAPENIQWLEKNVAMSRAIQIRVYPLAVANAGGRMTLYLKAESGWHSLWPKDAQEAVTVEATTLDAIIAELGTQPVDFLKIDCEGAEYELLAGREQLLRQRVRFIGMEYHENNQHQVGELQALLKRAGFAYETCAMLRWNTGMLYAMNLSLSH